MAAYNIEQIKDKKKLVKLANYGTAERRNMRPKVLIGAGEEKPFIEGDILDANATQNLIEDTYNKGRIFRSFSKEGKKIDKEIKELLEKTNENYEQLSSAIADNKEDADQKIDQLSSKVDNIESNIPNLRRVVDIQLQSVLDGTKTYLVTKQGDVQEEMQISDGEKGEQGEKGDPFTYEDFTPEQIEGLKVKGDRGISISSLEQTQTAYTSGGVNEFTITLDDGTVSRWYVRNGQKGDATKIWVNANTVHSGYYDSDNHEIKLLNADGGIMSIIDATAFIKDGMISDAYVEDGYIVIVFNTDSGKTPIMIPVTDIFDADDYYTKLDTDARIAEDVLVETQRAEAAELQLTDNIAQEVSDRLSGDTTLNTKIETETTRATNAEEALSDAIDAEESTRIQEIDDLQDLLDAYIQSNNAAVQAEISRATGAESTLQQNITAEETRATTAEQNLQNDIDAEEQRAIAAELDLLDAVDELEQSAGQGITEVQLALSDEITRATGAESQLSADLSAEITRATNADNANATAISNEVARATLSEQQNATDIDAIETLIPSQATSENQLADKAFVNSSIATSTATFVGTFNSITDLYAVTTADVNDYGYVVTTDSVGNTKYNRYKYDGSQWDFEYSLNNSSFTAEEWASIQSGMTQALREKLENLPSSATTSIGISVPTGFTVTGSPIVSSGTIAINFENGYSIPTIASQTNWDTAYGWGNHANAGYVKQVKVGTDAYNPTGGIVSLPAYPTTLPASDVYSWAKASTKPSYTLDEISDGSTRKLANYLPLSGGMLTGLLYVGSTGSNRATIELVSAADVPNDLYFGSHGVGHWSLSSRNSDEGHAFLLYNAINQSWALYFYNDSRAVFGNSVTALSFIKNGGTSSQFLKADGSVDSNIYATTTQLANYLPLSGGVLSSSNGVLTVRSTTEESWIYFQSTKNNTVANRASVGYYKDFAFVANEATYARIGIADNGVPQYWTNAAGSGRYTLIHSGNIGLQNVASAATLSTARTLWGQSFDGSGNVTGDMSSVGNIGMVDGKYIHIGTVGGGGYNSHKGYISAGVGYSENSGRYGLKILACDQADCQSGIGQDLTTPTGWSNTYNFCVACGNSSSDFGYLSFVSHKVNSTAYRYLGGFHDDAGSVEFQVRGNILAFGTVYATGPVVTNSSSWTYFGCTRGDNGSSSIGGVNGNGVYFCHELSSGSISYFYLKAGTGITLTNGNIYAPNFYTTSDSSKKDNITSLSEHIRKFTLKETGKEHYGVIAQEVEEMFREGEEGSYTVNYNSILSYYIGLLENRVAELENKVKELSHG